MPGELSDADVFGGAAPAAPALAAPLVGARIPPQGIIQNPGGAVSIQIGGSLEPGAPPPVVVGDDWRPLAATAPPSREIAPLDAVKPPPSQPAPQEFSDADVFGSAPAPPAPQKPPGVVSDILTGFAQPLQAWGHAMMENQRASLQAPTSPLDALRRMIPDPTVLGLPGALGAAVTGAVTRPIAGQVAKVLPTPYAGPQLVFSNGKVGLTAPHALDPTDAAQGVIETALSGARPVLPAGVPFGPRLAMPPAPSLDELAAAKNAAYAKVDQSGFTFPQADVKQLAADVAAEVARKAGPKKGKLYPASEAMAARLTAIAQQPNGVPLGQLDELRSDIWHALVAPGDRESTMGAMMRQKIDGLMDTSQAPDIREARDLNTRYEKVKTVTNKLDSAGLRAASTYSGGNYNNAVRQNLRPLIDPTSPQMLRNLTPEENAALRGAVTGTPVQNATRATSKLLTNKIVQVPFGVLTHGVGNAVMEGVGSVLNKVGERQTGKAVQAVLDLMASGGRPSPLGAASLPSVPVLPLFSGPGLTGVTAMLQPLRPTRGQVESLKQSKTARRTAPSPQP